MRFRLPILVACLWGAMAAAAPAEPVRIPLWPDGAPEAKGTGEADQPWMDHYRPEEGKANGCAVIVCPGGGYGGLALDHEGLQPALFFTGMGVHAFVLHYRLPTAGYRHPVPLHDAQRAVRQVRSLAAAEGLDPQRIGLMGFSAGGHLASSAGVAFDDGNPQAADAVDRESSRPDFLILCYPVISLEKGVGHEGSARNLLGELADDPVIRQTLSTDRQVTAATPPAFLFHTTEDAGVPVENSLRFYRALRRYNIPAEMHIYQSGPHGVGLMPGTPVLGTWPGHLRAWMRDNNRLGSAPRAAIDGRVTVNGAPVSRGSVTFSPDDPSLPVTSLWIRDGRFRAGADGGPAAVPGTVSLTFAAADVSGLSVPGGFVTTGSLVPDGEPLRFAPSAEGDGPAWNLDWPAAPR